MNTSKKPVYLPGIHARPPQLPGKRHFWCMIEHAMKYGKGATR